MQRGPIMHDCVFFAMTRVEKIQNEPALAHHLVVLNYLS